MNNSSNSTLATTDEEPKKKNRFWLYALGGVVLSVLVFLWWRSAHERHKKAEQAAAASRPKLLQVMVASPVLSSDSAQLLLPGDIQGYRETLLYARVNGYVKNWYVDIGDFVQEGQLLAEIETPELNQQLAQAQANQQLAKASWDRVNNIPIEGAVSKQQKDEREGAYKASNAMVNQLAAQTSFKRVIAPFAGYIVTRNIDIGTLVNAGSAGSKELFKLDQVYKLRIFVNVPQTFVPFVKEGIGADVLVQEFPGRKFKGKVRRTAGALDMATRTLLVQVDLDNPKRMLLPGMYAQVKFVFKRDKRPFVIPASVLSLRSQGPQVVTVTPQNTIQIKNVKISRDNGATLEIEQGLEGNEKMVVNPNLALTEGLKVQIVKR